ncbi:AMP-binding protein [Methylomonas sp. AM2-LC]|uniref:AMP-binding protein n=1 Tax=Methylomonas sp. AM2-LC TaxID=3153301 RepID=UPI0032667BF3
MKADTLPSALQFQSDYWHSKIAIRHKHLGIWHEKSWLDIKLEISRLATMLKINGFRAGDKLYLLTDPRPEALLISIAAQWLGGVSAPLDINDNEAKNVELLQKLKPSYVFAEGQFQVDLVQKLDLQVKIIIYADARGLSGYQHGVLKSYSALCALENPVFNEPAHATSNDVAFVFFRLDAALQTEVEYLTHADMLTQGAVLIDQEKLTAKEEAFAARTFAASGHMRYLLAPWLLAGFTLNFPENINTRDLDRREIGPTLVAGTLQTYQRLESLIYSRLPAPGSFRRSIYDWSLKSHERPSPIRNGLAHWLIIRPLKDVLGFSYTRVPLLVGEQLSASSAHFFASLGIHVKHWPNVTDWHNAHDIPHLKTKLSFEQFDNSTLTINHSELGGIT